MKLESFDYHLPDSLIAQEPLLNRSQSRLLCCDHQQGTIEHDQFSSIVDRLPKNALLVFNDTKVINARLFAISPTGAKIECFLVEQLTETDWLVMAKPSKRLKEGVSYVIAEDFSFEVIEKHVSDKLHCVRFSWSINMSLMASIEQYGEPPLPPYIKTEDANHYSERYQTVFASEPGAIAAPTAGLHFDDRVLEALDVAGIETCSITLHVGFGTFTPITTDSILDHEMHYERYAISEASATALTQAIQAGRPIIAVGTTVCRCLESHIQSGRIPATESSKTNLYITPGYKFKAISGLITNFHLPKSSLFILVSSFAGRSFIQKAYDEAIAKQYRFYSFGDAMLLL